ncbi:hypothetical protein [Bacillus thuringiensis]|uniref:Uncharacterized protein n=1 Tax=Bacillus thuringiensis serovar andalousiensis TaxID=257985 RepID=A0A6H0TQA7_BACTU|nr:hypothetical protein [Bacillus thuringiensis]QIW22505.1 hypothetical protein EVG22_31670 [Bacillus thuringiensis serovar andalousiensis]
MTISKNYLAMSHHFNSMESVLRTISIKMPAAADGFEDFKVDGSALRHMGVTIESIANQFNFISQAIISGKLNAIYGNFMLISYLVEGCSFQLKHFGLSLKSQQHHIVPMCGANNPRRPVAENGFLLESISNLLYALSNHLDKDHVDLEKSLKLSATDIKTFTNVIGGYRKAMEDSNLWLAGEYLLNASENLEKVGKSFLEVSNTCEELFKL